MPTYEYECTKCRHTFERFQKMSDEPVKRCPSCRGKVRRIVGAGAGFIFKGSGFYQTDYRGKAYKDAASKDVAGKDAASKDVAGKDVAGKGTSVPAKSESSDQKKVNKPAKPSSKTD